MAPFITLKELKEELKYPDTFDEELAPVRYYKIKNELENRSRDYFVYVIYGMRRMGKTASSIKLGEYAQEKLGYRFLYYEIKRGKDERFGTDDVGKLGAKLARRVLEGEKLFVVIDEAFNVPIIRLKRFLEPFGAPYKKIRRGEEVGDFIIILTGSYAYDVLTLSFEITRIFMSQSDKRIIFPTTPRTGRIKRYISPKKESLDVFFRTFRTNERILRFLLESELIVSELNYYRLHPKVIEAYEEYKKTLGVPTIALGEENIDAVVNAFIDTLRESFQAHVDLEEKIDENLYRGVRIDFRTVIEIIKRALEQESGKNKLKDDAVSRLALNTLLILPRRRIKNKRDIDAIIGAITSRSVPNLPPKATPLSLFSYHVLARLNFKLSFGSRFESVIAHALKVHADYYENTFRGYITMYPISSAPRVDFLYFNLNNSDDIIGIEVKSSIPPDYSDIKIGLETSERLKFKYILAIPYESLGEYVPLYKDDRLVTPVKEVEDLVKSVGKNVTILPLELVFYVLGLPRETERVLRRL